MARYSEYNLVQVAGLFIVATVVSMGLIYFINAENQSRREARKGPSEHLGSPNRITMDSERQQEQGIEAMALVMRDSRTTLSSSSEKSVMKKKNEEDDIEFPGKEKLLSSTELTTKPKETQMKLSSSGEETMQEEPPHSSHIKNLVASFYHRFINGLKRISNLLEETKKVEGAEAAEHNYSPSDGLDTRLVSPRIKRSLIPEDEEDEEDGRQTIENLHYSKIEEDDEEEEESNGKNNVVGSSNKNNNKRIRHVMKKILRQQQHKMYDDKEGVSSNEDNHQGEEYKERRSRQDYLYDNEYDSHRDESERKGRISESKTSSGGMDSTNYYYETGESPYGSGSAGAVVGVGESIKGSSKSSSSSRSSSSVDDEEEIAEEESSEPLSLSNGLRPFIRKPSILLDSVGKDDMSINYLDIKRNGRSMSSSNSDAAQHEVGHNRAGSHVEINPITTDFCYKTDDVLIVVAITCCLNFTFVLGIWASVRWLGVGSSSSKRRRNRRMMRAASSNATMKMVAFTEDDAEAFGGGSPSHVMSGGGIPGTNGSSSATTTTGGSIVGKKFLRPNHCCLSYDEEDDLFFTSSSEEDDDEEEDDDDDETYYYGTDVKDNLVFDNKKDNQRRVFFNKRLSLRLAAAASSSSKVRKRSRSMEDLRCSFNHLTV